MAGGDRAWPSGASPRLARFQSPTGVTDGLPALASVGVIPGAYPPQRDRRQEPPAVQPL
jgi:hypothetical protein